MKDKVIIAIDGPAGAGKSTIARLVAQHFNFFYVDTGAMYRALTLKAIKKNINMEDSRQLQALVNETSIDLKYLPSSRSSSGLTVFLDDEDVTSAIRSCEVTNKVFYVARDAGVREKMVEWQRELAEKYKKAVLEGRDIGTVVFPKADIKFFLDAKIKERANRRYKEFKEKNVEIDFAQIEQDIINRDETDKTREVGPLKKADDAVYIDTTDYSIEEVLYKVVQAVKNVL